MAAIVKNIDHGDHANDTLDALMQAEAFISGFEDDETQEGVADILAGLRAAIQRELHVDLLWCSPDCKDFSKAKGDKVEDVKEFREWGPQTERGSIPDPEA